MNVTTETETKTTFVVTKNKNTIDMFWFTTTTKRAHWHTCPVTEWPKNVCVRFVFSDFRFFSFQMLYVEASLNRFLVN